MAENGKNNKAAKQNPGDRIKSLSDLYDHHSYASSSDSDSDSDGPQENHARRKRSGIVVQGPKRNNDNDAGNDNLERAREITLTMQGPFGQVGASSSSRSFSGTGRSLSEETDRSQPPQPVVHNITFWRNGFTVADGSLRRFNSHENAEFLQSIMGSECPKELEPADRRLPVHVNVTRRNEDYPFKGAGRTLGSSSSSVPEPTFPSTSQSGRNRSSSGFAVDVRKPWTSIQIRLSDGTRMIVRFNHHHTVGDIRALINAARPGGGSTYQLQAMGFPPKPLTDAFQTIEQAGLINSVVLQKF